MLSLRIAAWLSGFIALAAASSVELWRKTSAPRAVLEVSVSVDTSTPIAVVDERFLSLALDMASVVGGAFWDPAGTSRSMGTARVKAFDFSRPGLKRLSTALAPAYLRVGGTDADRTVYELSGAHPRAVPEGTWSLSTAQWRNLNTFAQESDFKVMFTLNAGVSARAKNGEWDPQSARALIEDATRNHYPVAVWEFGNELNVYPLLHAHWLSPGAYANDLQQVRWLLNEASPGTRLAGPAVAFWPHVGEGLPFLKPFMKAGGDLVDVISWHYYPQQSYRCPVATNRARAGRVLRPQELGEVDRWASYVESAKRDNHSEAELWLGETGGAQCGGEPGLSDRFGSSLWWIDELGQMARRGQKVVVRQSLVGGDYGLLNEATLAPNPDYWASVLWKRSMGTRVLNATLNVDDAPLQVYAHCLQGGAPGGVALALINEHPQQTTQVALSTLGGEARVLLVTAESATAREISVNGQPAKLGPSGEVTDFAAATLRPSPDGLTRLPLPPFAYAFVLYPDAHAVACQSAP